MKFDHTNLPSLGIPYAVKSIEASPFRPLHLAMLSEAIFLDNKAPLIEAVGMAIDFDVRKLTEGDFYYILTWLRFASRDLPIFADWQCTGVVFRRADSDTVYTMETIDAMVTQWEAALGTEAQTLLENPHEIDFYEEDCDHENKQTVAFEDFQIQRMSEDAIDPRLDYPRVDQLVDYLDLGKDVRNKKIIGPVQYIKAGATLREKLNGALEATDMELFDLASRAHFKYAHGVVQRVYKKCERCGVEHPFDVMIDEHSFFI